MRFLAVAVTLGAALYAGFAASAANNQTGLNHPHGASMPPPALSPPSTRYAGLWDKPNQACIAKCESFIKKGCFAELTKKNPTASPISIQDQCDDKYSLCLYDCMCDTCDENQIIIKQN